MKTFFAAIIFAVALQTVLFCQTTKQNANSRGSAQTISAQELRPILEDWTAARIDRNPEILKQLIAENFVFTNANGESLSKSEFLSKLNFSAIELPTAASADYQIAINGDEATITFTVENEFAKRDANPETVAAKQENVRRKWVHLKKQFERRADLIPNLFEVVKAAKIRDSEFFGKIAETRARLLNAMANDAAQTDEQIKAIVEANAELNETLSEYKLLPKKYARLRSDVLYENLTSELVGVENRIAVAQSDYYAAVRDFNKSVDPYDKTVVAVWQKTNGKWLLISERIENKRE